LPQQRGGKKANKTHTVGGVLPYHQLESQDCGCGCGAGWVFATQHKVINMLPTCTQYNKKTRA